MKKHINNTKVYYKVFGSFWRKKNFLCGPQARRFSCDRIFLGENRRGSGKIKGLKNIISWFNKGIIYNKIVEKKLKIQYIIVI